MVQVIDGIDPRAQCCLQTQGGPLTWSALDEARVSVLDRGFIFGDGVYEVIPVYDGLAFRLYEHLARLRRSLGEAGIALNDTDAQWAQRVAELVARNAFLGPTVSVYLQVTRGVARRDHAPPAAAQPTIFGMCSLLTPPSAAVMAQGLSAVTLEDPRWQRCDIKTISLIGNVFARQYALAQGADETIMFRHHWLTEASAANVWVVSNGVLRAPPSDHAVLQGIRVALLEQIADEEDIAVERFPVHRDAVMGADEILVTSAGREVLPVTRLDGAPVGTGAPGPMFARLHAAYQRAKRSPAHATALAPLLG